MTSGGGIQIPSRLPLLLTHEGVLLPGSTVRFSVDSPRNMHLVSQRLLRGTSLKSTIIGVIPNTRDPEHDTDDLPTLHKIGTAGIAVQVVGSNWPKPHYTLLITGLCRFSVSSLLKERPFVLAEVEQLDKLEQYTTPATEGVTPSDGEIGELSQKFYQAAVQLLGMLDMSVPVVAKFRRLLDSLPRETLPDVVASMIRTSNKEKLQVLDAVSLEERFKKALPMLTRQIEGLKLLQKTRKMGPDNEKRVLSVRKGGVFPGRQFNLDEEDEDDDGDDTASLERKVHGANMPEAALRVCLKELKRLKKMPQSMPEYALTRNYLDLMVELPWSKSTKDCLDIRAARTLLDNDHYAMDKPKRRVLEYLAVRQLKTSLKALAPRSRNVKRLDLGESQLHCFRGACDQSDIRGQQVLDPEQNHSFTDHYLNVAFDLSQVLFIATANTTATIPPALLDRMEVLQVPGYTQEEKVEIAHRHLIPNQLEQHGLTPQQLHIPQDTTQDIISRYTREAGVRSLERKLGAICRAVAVKVAEGHRLTKTEALIPEGPTEQGDKAVPPEMPIVIDHIALKDILGPPLFEMEVSERFTLPGVALGLVWTPLGGEIMFVEASRMEGEGQLTLTGQLGDVMKESAHLAISWLRANAKTYQLTSMVGGPDPLEGTDIHLHFPAGAVTKDGPSAGVTIVTCLASLFSGRLVRSDVAMTGEITLRGLVLPVGGIKDKVLAAYRAGVKRVILPKRNEKDLEELPANVRADLDFVTAGNLDEVLNAAFDGGFPGTASTRTHHQLTSKL
ncbi:lon protease homolog 2, peroxisomal [Lates japonicus]|uniref:Lon protease homolog n=1 Tax=Lates japonicus TaxID=270547 RepID=A0AAD3RA21_LATJO|nr:lon protease homolog 2, peroxisomal [Lates japonicus]